MYIEGRIVNRSYDDKEGNKRYTSEIVVQTLQFLGSKGTADSSGAAAEPDVASSETRSGDDDDLPF